ncbi:FAD-dependent oxidoreductase [Allomuricauda sp. SCSIO 65647]|uniref:FAD-dependent oxidoreductase n=1 Tax=Allomuricauda sp. SCSIO 65647 TaxID=2908843 RepID=UPI001F310677|nr:FAD-dependent oxidoreductase [Muricauda sp. SCSIO 65647]UJH68791.1 FAD-dependent oxidoreductase [Muricauda sp. SCSIO 65647]
MSRYFSLLPALFLMFLATGQQQVDVLIIGGGAGGTAAGIQAARSGVKVQVLERTTWLGGMLTSAGVSAIDGNHNLPSGIWGEFRQRLRDHYGGAKALATGWVSHTLFEPSVGDKILKEMADIDGLDVQFSAAYQTVEKEGEGWKVVYDKNGKKYSTTAKVLIDATETGELLPMVEAEFRLGMDAKSDTAEKEAPEKANAIIQDLTYVAILEDVSKNLETHRKKGLVKKPRDYDPKAFECACKREGGEMFGSVSDCQQMLNYGKLPNGKYMINWPNCGNDFYIDWPNLSEEEVEKEIEKAKAFTQGFIYYIQNDLGFAHLRLADEFPTKDGYPMIPYHREGRRAKGKVFLTVDHLERPYDFTFYRTGVAIGDYPIDHHHDKNEAAPEIDFINIKVPSYTIPMGAMIPEKAGNFLVADKNISVSNIVNGTTRLQPVVLGIGQAAGAMAATAVQKKQNTSGVSVRDVQNSLLASKAYLMPFIDVSTDDAAFAAMQRIGATGILKGYGVPYKWANETWFYPGRIVSEHELKQGLLDYYPKADKITASGKGATLKFLEGVFSVIDKEYDVNYIENNWKKWHIDQPLSKENELNRRTVSILVDQILRPFEKEIDFEGKPLGSE